MKTRNVKIIQGFKSIQDEGAHHRVICLTGKNKGTSYFFQSDIITLGRSEDVDIYIEDAKSSRKHLELKRIGKEYIATDLGSQNGVIINNLKVVQRSLKNGDKIVIGRTVYRYDHVHNHPKNDPSKSNEGHSEGQINNEKRSKDAKKRVIILASVFFVLYIFSQSSEDPSQETSSRNSSTSRKRADDDFVRRLKKKSRKEDEEQSKKLEVILRRGLREYRERNYFRAIHEFNLALITNPENSRAIFYKSKAQQRLQEEIETHLKNGQLEIDANKYSSARQSYCMVIRLLKGHPQDANRVKAEEKIQEIEVHLGLAPQSIKCLRSVKNQNRKSDL